MAIKSSKLEKPANGLFWENQIECKSKDGCRRQTWNTMITGDSEVENATNER